jgi:hypothetical protein
MTKHSETCNSQFLLSQFDKTCPRCAQVWKVVQLRRRTIHNGASVTESQTAASLANVLVVKFELTKAELTDRLYTSPTNQLPTRKTRSNRSTRAPKGVIVDDFESVTGD